MAASPDGSRVYVAGDFTTADGQPRKRLAAYDTATGQLVASFDPKGPSSQGRAPSPSRTTRCTSAAASPASGLTIAQQPARPAGVRRRAARLGPERRLHRLRSRPRRGRLGGLRRWIVPERRRSAGLRPGQDRRRDRRPAAVERDRRGAQRRRRRRRDEPPRRRRHRLRHDLPLRRPAATSRDRSRCRRAPATSSGRPTATATPTARPSRTARSTSSATRTTAATSVAASRSRATWNYQRAMAFTKDATGTNLHEPLRLPEGLVRQAEPVDRPLAAVADAGHVHRTGPGGVERRGHRRVRRARR